LLAELGLALAGFAGVAAAFGGRAREYGKVDFNRLMILFACAAIVVAGSLLIITLAAQGLADATIYFTASAAMATVTAITTVPIWLTAFRNVRNPTVGAPAWVFCVSTAFVVAVETLYVLNLFESEPGPLIAAFSLSLLYGLWVFIRLMTRPN
jgi:hypothetical protein